MDRDDTQIRSRPVISGQVRQSHDQMEHQPERAELSPLCKPQQEIMLISLATLA